MSGRTFISWSGGKDSSLAFYTAQQAGVNIEALLTTVTTPHNRVSMHGVRRELIEAQAASLGLPLYTIQLPEQPDMIEYETEMAKALQRLSDDGFTQGIYGDIFLEDLKAYREVQLNRNRLKAIFPLWKLDSEALMQEFIGSGFKAIAVCINSNRLAKEFCGRFLDQSFVADLPTGVDICGENGEYHSFVFDGPIFSHPIAFKRGELLYRKYAAPAVAEADNGGNALSTQQLSVGFWFCDLLPPV